MRIAVVGAHGKSDQAVTAAARRAGIEVTAITRRPDSVDADHQLVRDALELTAADLAGFDAVVDALGYWTAETMHFHKETAEHLVSLLCATPTRLIIIGGAGTLFVDPDRQVRLADTPEFPAEFQAVAQGTAQSLAVVEGADDVAWTYVSPAADYRPDGAATDRWAIGDDHLHTSEAGESVLSYADMGSAVVSELLDAKHVREHISVYTR